MDAKRRNMLAFLCVVVFINLVAASLVITDKNVNFDLPCDVFSEQETVESELGREVEAYFLDIGKWVWGDDKDTKKIVEDAARRAVRRGVPIDVFQDISVVIFPLESFNETAVYFAAKGIPAPIETANSVGITFDVATDDSMFCAIWLAGRDDNLSGNFIHEVGHVFSWKYLNTSGYGWPDVNAAGVEYLKIKGYPVEIGLDQETQEILPWEHRIDEWFANDFEYLFYDEGDHRAGPIPTPEVAEFFNKLFSSQRG
ncbi:MAG: hypothetical protein ACOX2E_03460 [Syntrophaceticus sp.]